MSMVKGILLSAWVAFWAFGCAEQSDNEEVRVIYYAGFPNEQLNKLYPGLQVSLHAPYEITVHWRINDEPTYLNYAQAGRSVSCDTEQQKVARNRNVRLRDLKPDTEYQFFLCPVDRNKSDEIDYSFKFQTPDYNILSIEQWCDYPDKSPAMERGFELLFENIAVSSCHNLLEASLKSNIEIDSKSLVDLYPFTVFQQDINSLYIENVVLADISVLSRFTSLESLDLVAISPASGQEVIRLEWLPSLQKLRILSLDRIGAAILVHSELQQLPVLTNLRLSSMTSVVSFSASALKNLLLKSLVIEAGFVPNLEDIQTIRGLEKLVLNSSQLESLQGLSSLSELKVLRVKNNLVSDIGEVASLENLEVLDIESNPVSELNSVATLTQLTEVDVRSTDVPALDFDLSNLQKNLTHFYFRGSPLFDGETCPFKPTSICSELHGDQEAR